MKIIIKDNPHLKTLSIPNLQRIRLSKSNPRLLLVNNPHLQMPDFDPDETEETSRLIRPLIVCRSDEIVTSYISATEMPPEPSLPPSQKNYTLPGGITRHTPRHRVRPTKHAPRSKKGKEPDEGSFRTLFDAPIRFFTIKQARWSWERKRKRYWSASLQSMRHFHYEIGPHSIPIDITKFW